MSATIRSNSFGEFARTGLRLAWIVGLASTMAVAAVTTSPTALAAGPLELSVNLRTAATYGVLSGASVANTVSASGAPYTIVRGYVGVSSAGAISGFKPLGPGVVTGTIDSNNATAVQAIDDLTIAYNEAAGRAPTGPLPAVLDGQVFTPGVYHSVGAVGAAASGIVTLNGPADGVFVFQVDGALAMGANTQVVLTGGAQATNVFWQVNGAASTGAGSTFTGTIMATTTIGLGAGTRVNGRALALTGAITMDNTSIHSTPAFVAITGGANHVVADSDVTIAGTSDADAGTLVSTTLEGVPLPSTYVDASGTWSVHVGLLLNGVYTVTASTTDGAGNVGSATQSLTIDTVAPVVVIADGASAMTNDATPTITGTSDTGQHSIVNVDIDAQTYTALVQSDGAWNFTIGLLSGNHAITAVVEDAAGNVGTASQILSVDTAAPIVTINSGLTRLTNSSTPTVTGTADTAIGSTVIVTVAGQVLSSTVASDQSWTATATQLADGVYPIAASATDLAGNTGITQQTLTVDAPVSVPPVTVPPTPPATVPPATPPSPASDGRVRLTAIRPSRLADTRAAGAVRLAAGGVLRVNVAGASGVPDNATAAALNVTAVGPDAAGFLTVYPCTGTVPETSSVNFAARRDIANSTIATLDLRGDVCVYTSTGTHVVVDITAWLSPTGENAMTAAAPRRVADTRSGVGSAGRLAAGEVLTVATGDTSDSAVALNVTVVGADAAGFVTVYPCGTTPPQTSTVNYARGEARPNNAIVAVGPGGLVCVFSSAAADVLVDVTGVFAPVALLVYLPAAPQRLLDTRATGVVRPGAQVAFGVPSGVSGSAVSVNVTSTGHTVDGYATAFGCGANIPDTSTLNQRVGEDNSNGAIVLVGPGSAGCVFTSSATNAIVDLNGWWIPATPHPTTSDG